MAGASAGRTREASKGKPSFIPKKRGSPDELVDQFRKGGGGFQRRINAVLLLYVQQKRKKRA
jgi:uncharacterized protein (DUF4415 family)